MLHVTCDLCGKELRTGEDLHYVVKIEAYAAADPAEITEADLDEDHMDVVSQLLQECEDNDCDVNLVEPYKEFRYDLCQDCHRKFVRDPMRGRKSRISLSAKIDKSGSNPATTTSTHGQPAVARCVSDFVVASCGGKFSTCHAHSWQVENLPPQNYWRVQLQ